MSKREESEGSPKKGGLGTTSDVAAQPSAASFVPVTAQSEVKEEDNDSSSDEGRMQIILEDIVKSSENDESSASEVDADNSAAVPTTIVNIAGLDDEPIAEAAAADESIIPTTVFTSDDHEPPVVTETSAAAFNSFWKYKKVPKGPKVKQTFELEIPDFSDPAKPLVFTDPVFDKSQQNVVNYVNFGKIRVGEGNDITPNPEKLLRLGSAIQEVNDRMMSLGNSSVEKREKMKLSSRICRMKRTANHEANKIKFAGLQQEREELCRVIREMKRAKETIGASAATLTDQLYHTKVAGRSSEYVNSVLEGTQQYGERTYLGSDSDSDY